MSVITTPLWASAGFGFAENGEGVLFGHNRRAPGLFESLRHLQHKRDLGEIIEAVTICQIASEVRIATLLQQRLIQSFTAQPQAPDFSQAGACGWAANENTQTESSR